MNDQNQSNFDPFLPQATKPVTQKKNNRPLITAFSVLGVLIILLLAAFIYYLLFLSPTRTLIMGNQGAQVSIQETALQAAAEATAMEMYLHPSQMPPSQTEPTQPPSGLIQAPGATPVSGNPPESAAPVEPAGNSKQGLSGTPLTKSSLTSQLGLLGILGLATMLLLAIIIVRRLRAPKK